MLRLTVWFRHSWAVASAVRFRRSAPVALAAVAIGALALAGCGGSSSSSSSSQGAASSSITVHTAAGTVTLPHRPSRIVSLSATATEDLYAVGAGQQVVAVDSYSTYPPQAPRTKLSGFTPNVEAIAKYQPDLVVIDGDTNHIAAQLGRLHIPVLIEPPATNLNAVYAQLDEIAAATGHSGAASAVVTGMQRQISAIVRSVKHPSRPLTVYHELDQTRFSANSHTFIGQLYTLLGLHDIADQAHSSTDYPQLSAEYIIARNPSLIVLADTVCCGQSRATLASRPGWSNIAAVKRGDVVAVDDSIASQWGPRIVLFLRAVADAVNKLEHQATTA